MISSRETGGSDIVDINEYRAAQRRADITRFLHRYSRGTEVIDLALREIKVNNISDLVAELERRLDGGIVSTSIFKRVLRVETPCEYLVKAFLEDEKRKKRLEMVLSRLRQGLDQSYLDLLLESSLDLEVMASQIISILDGSKAKRFFLTQWGEDMRTRLEGEDMRLELSGLIRCLSGIIDQIQARELKDTQEQIDGKNLRFFPDVNPEDSI